MKRIVLSLVFFAACSYADVPPLTCTSPNTVTGVLGASVGSTMSGCLNVGGTQGANENVATDGLWVNPGTDIEDPNFQTDGLSVAWAVTNMGGGVYQYEYTFSEVTDGNNISHIILGVGNQCTSQTTAVSSPDCIYNLEALSLTPQYPSIGIYSSGMSTAAQLLATTMQPTLVNPELPWSTEALSVLPNTGQPNNYGYTIDFYSTGSPTWQNVYVRDGGDEAGGEPATIEAWNNAVGGSTPGFYIAAPAPEASFYVLFAVFMTGLFLAFRFSRKRRSM
jgi:hypothetical protein